jgi:hypothetical protein
MKCGLSPNTENCSLQSNRLFDIFKVRFEGFLIQGSFLIIIIAETLRYLLLSEFPKFITFIVKLIFEL